MRVLLCFLIAAFASLLFVLFGGSTPQVARVRDDLLYAVTVALPASLPRLHFALGGRELTDAPQPVPHSELLAGLLESRGKSLFSPKEMWLISSARAVETVIANLDAQRGGIIRFNDGSYFAVAPRYLSHDVGLTVGLCRPALPELSLLEPASEAMIISFEPVKVGLAYADPASTNMRGAIAAIVLSPGQRASSRGHMLLFVQRVFSSDGSSADFEESPSALRHLMAADLAANHVLRYTAHVQGSILVSLQRVKSGAMVGLGVEGGGV